jgi:ABC-type antimicrobial peptide transport system permease subunit
VGIRFRRATALPHDPAVVDRGITLMLAMIGLYGVIAYSTSQRTSEIGVRVAIGAQRADVIRLVLIEGARLAVAGIVLGLAGSYWASRLLSAFLYRRDGDRSDGIRRRRSGVIRSCAGGDVSAPARPRASIPCTRCELNKL